MTPSNNKFLPQGLSNDGWDGRMWNASGWELECTKSRMANDIMTEEGGPPTKGPAGGIADRAISQDSSQQIDCLPANNNAFDSAERHIANVT